MTTEKCHSVCLLVHDIIFFSPKNKPCVTNRYSLLGKIDESVKALAGISNLSFPRTAHLLLKIA